MKVTFILPNLLAGGTQRVMITVLNHIPYDKYEVSLVVVNDPKLDYNGRYDISQNFKNQIDCRVKIIELKNKGIKFSILSIRKAIKSIDPDIVFSSLSYLNLYLAIFRPFLPRKGIKYIARESNTLSVKRASTNSSKWIDLLYKKYYKRFDLVIAQSDDMYEDLVNNYNIEPHKITKINNPIDASSIRSRVYEPYEYDPNIKHIICVGHMSYQKGYDMLIPALAELSYDNWNCHLLGRDAGELERINKLIQNYPNLHGKIIIHGFQSNPFDYLYDADLFVLSSRFEGFPNVMIEAGVMGLPIVAFDNPGGMAEILNDPSLGKLAKSNDISDLSIKIHEALETDYQREKISNLFIERFGLEAIIKKYDDAFSQI